MGGRRIGDAAGIDRGRPLRFTFDGRPLQGYAGDTLASALLAAGVAVVGRSFKYHRPRGIFSAGVEEPNALVRVGDGRLAEPIARATEVELYEGLAAASLNAWPSARWDLLRGLDRLHSFLPAGFYYKSFKWPGWNVHSKAIRALAGLGRLPEEPDGDRYVKRNAWCDLLVIGAGPAGLSAALAAAERGASVMLLEQGPALGGSALWRPESVEGTSQRQWAQAAAARIAAMPNARVLTRTMAFGYYDDNLVAAVERLTDHLALTARGKGPRQRLWKIRAGQVILASGAIERPMVFPDNDRPGVMLAGAVHEYLARYGVLAGERPVVVTNNDGAYAAALALRRAGVPVRVLDSRAESGGRIAEEAAAAGIETVFGARVLGLTGAPVRRIRFASDDSPRVREEACDLVAVSAGWTPTVHLYSQAGGALRFDERLQAFVPDRCPQPVLAAGAAAGLLDLHECIRSGRAAGAGTTEAPPAGERKPAAFAPPPADPRQLGRTDRQWIDLHNDVTVADVELAARENFVSVEHLKRYTTAGMAVDQGKTSNVNALLQLALLTGRTPEQVGTTKFRPPFAPVTIGALAGQAVGERFHPLRRLPLHDAHRAAGAAFTEMSGWLRPEYYPRAGEDARGAIHREARAVRTKAGLYDSSPLGKIEISGSDAAAFLDRLYAFAPSSLGIGRVRGGLLTDDHGAIVDDSHVARLASHRFLLVTTTAAASVVASMIERSLQREWPDLDAFSTPVTTQWAMLSLAGPNSLDILRALDPLLPVEALGEGAVWEGGIGGLRGRVLRISYSGEHAYEIMVPALCGATLWQRLREVGERFGLEPFGLEALDTLRIEKGFIHVGVETDAATSPADLGLAEPEGEHHLGARSSARAESARQGRLQLVGLAAEGGPAPLPVGAEIASTPFCAAEGHVTSSVYSPNLGRPIALAMLADGRTRHGERVTLQHGRARYRAVVVGPCFHLGEGAGSNG